MEKTEKAQEIHEKDPAGSWKQEAGFWKVDADPNNPEKALGF